MECNIRRKEYRSTLDLRCVDCRYVGTVERVPAKYLLFVAKTLSEALLPNFVVDLFRAITTTCATISSTTPSWAVLPGIGLAFSNKATMATTKSFPFLSLPKEIRLMVYERIPIQVEERSFSCNGASDYGGSFLCNFSLIDRTTTTAILSTCREIRDEATKVIEHKKMELALHPPRMMVNIAETMTDSGGPLRFVAKYLAAATEMCDAGRAVSDLLLTSTYGKSAQRIYMPGFMLPIALRWIKIIRYRPPVEPPASDKHPAPTIEIGIKASPSASKNGFMDDLQDLMALEEQSILRTLRFDLRLILDECPHLDALLLQIFSVNARLNGYMTCRLGGGVTAKEYKDSWSEEEYHRGASY